MVIRAIGMPPQKHEPGTTLRVYLDGAVDLDPRFLLGTIDCDVAMARFEALQKLVPVEAISALHERLGLITNQLLDRRLRDVATGNLETATNLLKQFSSAASAYLSTPLVTLDQPILLPPRRQIHFLSHTRELADQKLTVHVVGTRALDWST